MAIKDAIAKALIKLGAKFSTRVIQYQHRDRIGSQFGGGPESIGAAMRGALNGDTDAFQTLCAIFDRYALSDPRLRAVYEKRRRKVINWPWSTEAAEEGDDAENIRDLIDADLKNIPRFSRTILWELSDAIGKGFAAVELIGSLINGRWTVTDARGIPQWALRPKTDVDGYPIENAWEHKTKTGWEDVPDGKLLIWELQNQGSYLTGGLMWSTLWYACFKNFSIKDWIAFMEAYGQPFRLGYYPPQFDENSPEVETLARAVIDIAADAGAIVPEGMKIEFANAMKSGSPEAFENLAKYIDEALAELYLGGTLTTSAGEKGARSLGDVHQDETHEIVAYDARDLAETITWGLIRPMVIWNHGPQKSYPKFEFSIVRVDDLTKWANLDSIMMDRGFPIRESQLRTRYGYEPIDPDNPDDAFIARSAQGQQISEEKKTLKSEGSGADIQGSGFRVQGTGEIIASASEFWAGAPEGDMAEGLESQFVDAILPVYDAAFEAIAEGAGVRVQGSGSAVESIRAVLDASNFSSKYTQSLSSTLLPFLLAAIADVLDESAGELPVGESIDREALIGEAIEALTPENRETIANVGADPRVRPGAHIGAPLQEIIAATIELPSGKVNVEDWTKVKPEAAIKWWSQRLAVTETALEKLDDAARAYAFTISGMESQRVIDAAYEGIQAALEEGESLGQFRKRMKEAQAAAGLAKDAQMNPWHIETVFRQNVLSAYGAGRAASQRSAAVTKHLRYLLYRSMHDGRERSTHRALDNVCLPADHEFWDKYYPPWEWNCRCRSRSVRTPPPGAKTDITSIVQPPIGAPFDKGNPVHRWRAPAGGAP